jgi:neutral ceramidase
VFREVGQGSAGEDPDGPSHTIDPDVDVLRVDKVRAGRRVPIGIFSTFANHGTVVKPTFPYYNADHHAAAARVAEQAIRRAGDVPRSQDVVNAYGNADQGDMTAGMRFTGPAGAEAVGRREAGAFLRAWRRAGRRMTDPLHLRTRWTIECFCGRQTAAGPVDERAAVGLPFLTGSEENRGPLYDVTGVPFEGDRLPFGAGPQGVKIQAVPDPGDTFPLATPLTTIRVADRAIVTVPGEMTAGMGRRLKRNAAAAVRSSPIDRIVISGLANDFLHYFTSPEEYDRQHFEGGATLFGRATAVFIEERLIELLKRLVAGRPAPEPDFYDARNGVVADGAPFPTGARAATALSQPTATERLDRASFRWRGGENGTDRPLERAFVRIQRRAAGRWQTVDSDLGLRILWTVGDRGDYEALWQPGHRTPLGAHRFLITANHYRLASKTFELRPASDLRARSVAPRAGEPSRVELLYPEAVENRDLTWRPRRARVESITPGGGRCAPSALKAGNEAGSWPPTDR